MMYIFKICKSSLLQVPRWGGRNYLKKKYLKGRLKTPQKPSLFGFQRGVKWVFFRFFSWKVWKKGQGLIFQHNFLASVTRSGYGYLLMNFWKEQQYWPLKSIPSYKCRPSSSKNVPFCLKNWARELCEVSFTSYGSLDFLKIFLVDDIAPRGFKSAISKQNLRGGRHFT